MEEEATAVKELGNEFFRKGQYRTAAELYKKAVFFEPDNHLLYGNLSAAFLRMGMLDEALLEARTATTLAPGWAKGHFREGCALEAMGHHEDALAAFFEALQLSPQSPEVSRKIERLTISTSDERQCREVEIEQFNVDMRKVLDPFKCDLAKKIRVDEAWRTMFSFVIDTFETALNDWCYSAEINQVVHFLLGENKSQIDEFKREVDIQGAFESRKMRNSCFSFLQTYAKATSSRAACIVVPKSKISYPQVWKEERLRKWKYGQCDGFFVQFESPALRKLWFVPSKTKGQTRFKGMEVLDINVHELFPRLFDGVPDMAKASSTVSSACMDRSLVLIDNAVTSLSARILFD